MMTAALATDLRLLTAAVDEPGTDILQSLQQLAADAAAAVRNYLGLSVIVAHNDPLFTSTYLIDGVVASDIRASLRLTLPAVDEKRPRPAVALILYAGSPGTFIDLAADLAWLTARPLSDFAFDQHLTIPAGSVTSGQLRAASVINQAIGVLIDRGYTPARAVWELDLRAVAAGTDRHGVADLLLATLSADDAGEVDQDLELR